MALIGMHAHTIYLLSTFYFSLGLDWVVPLLYDRILRFAGGKLHKNPVSANHWSINDGNPTDGLLGTGTRSAGRGPTSRDEPIQPLNRRFEPLRSDI